MYTGRRQSLSSFLPQRRCWCRPTSPFGFADPASIVNPETTVLLFQEPLRVSYSAWAVLWIHLAVVSRQPYLPRLSATCWYWHCLNDGCKTGDSTLKTQYSTQHDSAVVRLSHGSRMDVAWMSHGCRTWQHSDGCLYVQSAGPW